MILMETQQTDTTCSAQRPAVSLRTVIISVAAAQFMLPFMLSGAGPLPP